mgnify:CR=1 FL=1
MIFENKKEKKVIDPANQLASTPIDLVQLGLNEVAYIRPTIIDETMVWSIYNAAGDHMGAAQTREQAVGAILRHHMAPHYVN